jgi:hypothetical protein
MMVFGNISSSHSESGLPSYSVFGKQPKKVSRFEDFTAIMIQVVVFCIITQCSDVVGYLKYCQS